MSKTKYDDYFCDDLKKVFNEIRGGRFGNVYEFDVLLNSMCNNNDYYLIGRDYESYKKT